MHCNEEQLAVMAEHEVKLMEKMDGYIGIRAGGNIQRCTQPRRRTMASFLKMSN